MKRILIVLAIVGFTASANAQNNKHHHLVPTSLPAAPVLPLAPPPPPLSPLPPPLQERTPVTPIPSVPPSIRGC